MTQYIENLQDSLGTLGCIICVGEPLTVFACMVFVFYALSWFLCECAKWLGIECDEND